MSTRRHTMTDITINPSRSSATLADRCWLQQVAAAAANPYRQTDARISSLDWWESK